MAKAHDSCGGTRIVLNSYARMRWVDISTIDQACRSRRKGECVLSNRIGLEARTGLCGLCAVFLAAACGPIEFPEPQYESKKAVVQSDLNALTDESAIPLQFQDSRVTELFRLAFGGTDGASIRRFIDERIQYYLDPQDLFKSRVLPATTYGGWSSRSGAPTAVITDDVVDGASNLGSPNWFQGVLDGDTKVLDLPRLNLQIRLESSRVGIMLIGPGYTLDPKPNGVRYESTPLYRQGIIVHEARHSDCTGGLKQSDITAARSARYIDDFEATFENLACNHFHVTCPVGHALAGVAACDRHPWGAYAYGFLYAVAKNGPHLSRRERELLQYAAYDSVNRLLYLRSSGPDRRIDLRKVEAFKKGRFGLPDRSSTGVID